MSFEKPISTIRNAIRNSAEEIASKENINIPELRHLKAVLDNYKLIRDYNPDIFKKLVILSIKNKEIKDSLGKKLSLIFQNIFDEISLSYYSKLFSAFNNNDSLNNDFKQESSVFVNEMMTNIKNDPRIIKAFLGKEELLNNAIKNSTSSILEMLVILNSNMLM